MNNIERVSLPKIISMLNGCKVQFAIIDSSGKKHGNLTVVQPKSRRPLKHPFGTLTNFFVPYIENLKADESAEVPCIEFDIESMRSSIAAWTSKRWGNGACSTIVDKANKTIFVFRTNNELPF
jgi:hypothetical protein